MLGVFGILHLHGLYVLLFFLYAWFSSDTGYRFLVHDFCMIVPGTYIRSWFTFFLFSKETAEPDFGVASINYDLGDLLSKAVKPEETI